MAWAKCHLKKLHKTNYLWFFPTNNTFEVIIPLFYQSVTPILHTCIYQNLANPSTILENNLVFDRKLVTSQLRFLESLVVNNNSRAYKINQADNYLVTIYIFLYTLFYLYLYSLVCFGFVSIILFYHLFILLCVFFEVLFSGI